MVIDRIVWNNLEFGTYDCSFDNYRCWASGVEGIDAWWHFCSCILSPSINSSFGTNRESGSWCWIVHMERSVIFHLIDDLADVSCSLIFTLTNGSSKKYQRCLFYIDLWILSRKFWIDTMPMKFTSIWWRNFSLLYSII